MRLIDLDKTMVIYDEDSNAVIFGNLKTAEVEAISVEWIREYAKRFDSDRGHRVLVPMDYAIESMLAEWDWEKENDTN